MNHWQKLGLPVALGAVAGIINWQNVTSKLQPHAYVSLTRDIRAGEMIQKSDYTQTLIRHDQGDRVGRALCTWENLKLVERRQATRDLFAGQLITTADLTADPQDQLGQGEEAVNLPYFPETASRFFVGESVMIQTQEYGSENFRTLGPFRILAISRLFTEENSKRKYGGIDLAVAKDSKLALQLKSLRGNSGATINLQKVVIAQPNPNQVVTHDNSKLAQ